MSGPDAVMCRHLLSLCITTLPSMGVLWIAATATLVCSGCGAVADTGEGASALEDGASATGCESDDVERTGGRASCVGCHRFDEHVQSDVDDQSLAECPVGDTVHTDLRGIYTPEALPCGPCDASESCKISIQSVCSDGDGKQQVASEYADEWVCGCENRMWACRVLSESAASCPSEPKDP